MSDEGIEDAIHDSQAIRGFVGIDLNRGAALDATTLLVSSFQSKKGNDWHFGMTDHVHPWKIDVCRYK